VTTNQVNNTSLEQRVAQLEEELATLTANAPEDKVAMVVMSGDFDRIMAAFIIATGAAAMFDKVSMFFTFWAIPALRDPKKAPPKKDFMSRMFGWMLPKGTGALKLSKMNMMGMGTSMMKGLMRKKKVMGLDELIKQAADSGVEICICQMSMELMGMRAEEMIDYPGRKLCGVATFLAEAGTSKSTLFI